MSLEIVRDSLDGSELPCASISGSEVLGDLDDSNLSSEDEGVEVAVHGELALVDGAVVIGDDLVPDGVGGIDEVDVNDVQDLVEGLAASKRLEAVVGANSLGESVLALEDLEFLLDGVDSGKEGNAGEHLVLSGQLLEESEQVKDSLLVDGEDIFSLLVDGSVDEDLLDNVSGSPLDMAQMRVDMPVDDGSGDSDVLISVDSSDSGDDSVLSQVEEVDLVVGSGQEGSEFLGTGVGVSVDSVGSVGNVVPVCELGVNVGHGIELMGDAATSWLSDGDDGVDSTAAGVLLDGKLSDNQL
jgi:hypothetical protein